MDLGVGRVDVRTSKAREKRPGDEVVINNYSSSPNGLRVLQKKSIAHKAEGLVPKALFHGFGSGAGGCPHLQSQGKAPWGRGCN